MSSTLITKVSLKKRPYAYSKLDIEDPEDIVHRRAQFLIYKAMQEIDKQSKPSRIRVRITRMKIRIGRRLKKLKKSFLVSVGKARACVIRQMRQLGWCKDCPNKLPMTLSVI